RPMPDRAHAERAESAARGVLGPKRYAAEVAAGAGLTPGDVVGELETAVRRPVPQAPTRR
ncbi:hypothetical protein, partial [Streptomyces rubrogriseus]